MENTDPTARSGAAIVDPQLLHHHLRKPTQVGWIGASGTETAHMENTDPTARSGAAIIDPLLHHHQVVVFAQNIRTEPPNSRTISSNTSRASVY